MNIETESFTKKLKDFLTNSLDRKKYLQYKDRIRIFEKSVDDLRKSNSEFLKNEPGHLSSRDLRKKLKEDFRKFSQVLEENDDNFDLDPLAVASNPKYTNLPYSGNPNNGILTPESGNSDIPAVYNLNKQEEELNLNSVSSIRGHRKMRSSNLLNSQEIEIEALEYIYQTEQLSDRQTNNLHGKGDFFHDNDDLEGNLKLKFKTFFNVLDLN